MKFGPRKPSLKKSLKARTTGKLKREVKKAVIPGYGKKGMGWIKNPKKAAYNKVYHKTTFSVLPPVASTPSKPKKKTGSSGTHRQTAAHQNKPQSDPILQRSRSVMKICKYCQSTCDDTATVCPSCGAKEFKYQCENCGNVFDDGLYCQKCGVKVGSKAKSCPNCATEYYSAACPNCGYTANSQNSYSTVTPIMPDTAFSQPKKKRKTWLWVLGWIFIFPVPLTVLLIKNQKLSKGLRIGIIAAAWIIYFLIALSGNASTDTDPTGIDPTGQTGSTVIQETSDKDLIEPTSAAAIQENPINTLVNQYNESAANKLIFTENFIVSDKDSGHYRTEFRLPFYQDAIGQSYTIAEQVVDIICVQDKSGSVNMRIYTDAAQLELCIEIIRYASVLLDPAISRKEVDDAIQYISESKEANGYNYGKLGLLLIGNDNKGYDLMIKTD